MSKKYIIVVSDKVRFQVKGTTVDEKGDEVPFKFSLVGDRVDSEQLAKIMSSTDPVEKTLTPLITGWSDQRLVLEEDRTPAEFSAEAFASLMSIPFMAHLCFNAYHRATGAAVKN